MSTNVSTPGGVATAGVGTFSGTSAAQPHATGVLGVIMERFGYMSNEQAVSVMRTTAVQNATINDANGVQIVNPNAGKIVEVPDDRNGWGTVSLKNAMNGPGQFTGTFAVNTQGQSDTWSNNISDVAARARRGEDQAEAASWAARKAEKGWNVTPPAAPPAAPTDAASQQAYYASAAVNDYTEYQVGVAREAARATREYVGSLSKSGQGVITLTGNNSFTGGVDVFEGGIVAGSATALGTGNVAVFNGMLGVDSVDTVKIGGNLTLGPSSMLDLTFSFGDLAVLDVEGRASLGGLLMVSFDGFSSETGSFSLLTAGSRTGVFSNVQFSGLSPWSTASIFYTANGVGLTVAAVPEPETYALMLAGLGLMGFVASRRKQGTSASR
jgi:autotransporter-associated beta strand protein